MGIFKRVGPQTEVLDGGRSVRKTGEGHSFCLMPPLHDGSASVVFRLDFSPEPGSSDTFGVFPADIKLDSDILAVGGKRCALQTWVGLDGSGRALLLCDGVESNREDGLRWQRGDTIGVSLSFESSTAARVTFAFNGCTRIELLRDVPNCGLCLGTGLFYKGVGVTLVANDATSSSQVAACDKYRGDIAKFGYCKCGRPKSEHA